jgi:type I restriction enzyme S subunit
MIEPAFLAIMLESTFVRHQADRLARGIAQKTINLAEIRSFNVPVPDIKLQRDFVQRTGEISNIRWRFRASGEQLDAAFNALQHRAFRGEL